MSYDHSNNVYFKCHRILRLRGQFDGSILALGSMLYNPKTTKFWIHIFRGLRTLTKICWMAFIYFTFKWFKIHICTNTVEREKKFSFQKLKSNISDHKSHKCWKENIFTFSRDLEYWVSDMLILFFERCFVFSQSAIFVRKLRLSILSSKQINDICHLTTVIRRPLKMCTQNFLVLGFDDISTRVWPLAMFLR